MLKEAKDAWLVEGSRCPCKEGQGESDTLSTNQGPAV